MKVIFLDIDGVLNSRAYDRRRDLNKQTNIDETRLPLIKEIVNATDAKIVLSSTWRVHWNREPRLCDEDGRYINITFAKYGLAVYDKTPDLGVHAFKGMEISQWLKETEEEIESFVIIDDCGYGWNDLVEYFIKTDPNFHLGIELEQVEAAIKILLTKRSAKC